MISKNTKKKPTNSTAELKEKKMKIIQKKKAERIKEQLSGKIDSPIVAKAKSAAKAALKNKVPSQSPSVLVKKPLANKAEKLKQTTDKGRKKAEEPNVKSTEIPQPKAEVKPKSKALKRKPDEIANEVSKKKVKVAPLVGVSLRKTELVSTSPKKQKVKSEKQSVTTDNKIIQKSAESSVVKTKKAKLADKKGNNSGNKTSEKLNKKGALKVKPQKKNVVKKIVKSPGAADKSEPKVEGTSDPAVQTVAVKSVKKPRRKARSSISKLKPISNIKSLKKKPSPSTLRGRELRRKKLVAKYPERGVVYFSRIPHGFYEKELKKYCSQFGRVTGVYHPTSKKGNSKGYAFVEFEHKEVAQVVAETMNNYLMFYRLIKCKYLPPDEQKPWVFRRKLTLKKIADENRERDIKQRNKTLTEEEEKKWQERKAEKIKELHKKLAAMGVDYEFQVVSGNEEKQEVS